jgi:hypothetical protein
VPEALVNLRVGTFKTPDPVALVKERLVIVEEGVRNSEVEARPVMLNIPELVE